MISCIISSHLSSLAGMQLLGDVIKFNHHAVFLMKTNCVGKGIGQHVEISLFVVRNK